MTDHSPQGNGMEKVTEATPKVKLMSTMTGLEKYLKRVKVKGRSKVVEVVVDTKIMIVVAITIIKTTAAAAITNIMKTNHVIIVSVRKDLKTFATSNQW
jgi:hypothetical protein